MQESRSLLDKPIEVQGSQNGLMRLLVLQRNMPYVGNIIKRDNILYLFDMRIVLMPQ
nr:hypothetical protein Iba_scaffold29910CG0060 [Ipomoea batatas]